MASAALQKLETLLSTRRLDGTLAQAWRAGAVMVLSTGARALDEALDGGWRTGELSEITGAASSGRTSLLWATLARATADGHVVALVDTVDRFDPASAAAVGVAIERVLWVRGPSLAVDHARTSLLDAAVQRAIRAFDLILRAGGFAVVALDLADIPARTLRALPAATWLRLAHAVEGQRSTALLLGEAPIARSARGASVTVSAAAKWSGGSLQSRRLDGFDVHGRIARMTLPAGHTPAWTAIDATLRKRA